MPSHDVVPNCGLGDCLETNPHIAVLDGVRLDGESADGFPAGSGCGNAELVAHELVDRFAVVPTVVGPSGTPVNASKFISINSELFSIKSLLSSIKGTL